MGEAKCLPLLEHAYIWMCHDTRVILHLYMLAYLPPHVYRPCPCIYATHVLRGGRDACIAHTLVLCMHVPHFILFGKYMWARARTTRAPKGPLNPIRRVVQAQAPSTPHRPARWDNEDTPPPRTFTKDHAHAAFVLWPPYAPFEPDQTIV